MELGSLLCSNTLVELNGNAGGFESSARYLPTHQISLDSSERMFSWILELILKKGRTVKF